jgi:type IV pilus assembly protein PilW
MSGRAKARSEAGFTLIEVMISVMLAAIVTGFTFSIYTRASQSSRAQSRVAETQQTLRAATELVTREVRAAGMMARTMNILVGGQRYRGLSIDNNLGGFGPDGIRVVYADLGTTTRVAGSYDGTGGGSPAFPSVETEVLSNAGFAVGDLVIASHVGAGDANDGEACILMVTGIRTVGSGQRITHDPVAGAPWNQPGNKQCDPLKSSWDGRSTFSKFFAKAYRIKPNDPRGVLQVAPRAIAAPNDWQDIALGIIDMQLAILVYEPGDFVDADGDGNPLFDWYSGDAMETAADNALDPGTGLPPAANLQKQPLQVRVSLLAKVPSPSALPTARSPDFVNPTMGTLFNNDIGDRMGTPLPVTDPSSPYYGDNLYRWTSTMVDLRNLGVGVGRPSP